MYRYLDFKSLITNNIDPITEMYISLIFSILVYHLKEDLKMMFSLNGLMILKILIMLIQIVLL